MTKAPLIHIASMIYHRPLAIMPEKLEAILRGLGPRLRGKDDTTILAFDDEDLVPVRQKNDKGYRLTPEGIAIVPIQGTLMKRGGWMSAASGCSTYDQICKAMSAALGDPGVRAVLMDCDSPGGTTHGCFEASDAIYEMRQESDKPVWAVANDLAASAAYALASAADKIFVTRTGGVGSIGVFALQIDQSALDEQEGLKYNYVYAGAKKTDGNPHEPLSKSARADIQAEVDREYDMFVQAVARNRNTTQTKIRDTQAGVFFGDKSVGLLADEVASCDETLTELTDYLRNGVKNSVAHSFTSGNNAFNSKAAVSLITSLKNPVSVVSTTYITFLTDRLSAAQNSGNRILHAALSEELKNVLGIQVEESTASGDEDMKRTALADADEEVKKAKPAATEATDVKAAAKKDDEEDDDEDEEDDEDESDDDDEEDDKKKSTKSKSAAKATKSTKSTKSKKDDEDDDDDAEDMKGSSMRKENKGEPLPRVANEAAVKIAQLCTMQNVPHLAAEFMSKGYDVDKVIQELSDRRAAESRESDGMRSYISGDPRGAALSFEQAVAQSRAAAAQADTPVDEAKIRYRTMLQTFRAHPEIYEGYMDARDQVIAACPSGRGKALNDFVLIEQRRYMQILGLSTIIDDVPTRRSMV